MFSTNISSLPLDYSKTGPLYPSEKITLPLDLTTKPFNLSLKQIEGSYPRIFSPNNESGDNNKRSWEGNASFVTESKKRVDAVVQTDAPVQISIETQTDLPQIELSQLSRLYLCRISPSFFKN